MDDVHALIESLLADAPKQLSPCEALDKVRESFDQLESLRQHANGKATDWLIDKMDGNDPETMPVDSDFAAMQSASECLSESIFVLDEGLPLIGLVDQLTEELNLGIRRTKETGCGKMLAVLKGVEPICDRIGLRLDSMEARERKRRSYELKHDTAKYISKISHRLRDLESQREIEQNQRKATKTLSGAYVLYHAALERLTSDENSRPTVLECYQWLKTAVDSIVDCDELGIPQYKLPRTYDVYRKQLYRANKIDWDKLEPNGTN